MRKQSFLLLGALLLLLGGCGSPELNSLSPATGIPHTLVETDGDNFLARVVWNNSDTLPSSFLGARFFSVPHGATVGANDVKLVRGSSESPTPRTFTVLDPTGFGFPDPKLTYIQTLYSSTNATADSVTFYLFGQGPNVDLSAEVLVNGTAATGHNGWYGLRNSLNGIDSTTYGYPIFHTAMVYAQVTARIDDVLTISLRNDGGATSNTLSYTVTDSAKWDSDGDGLLDTWETNGYDYNNDGTIDVDLPGLGASPYFFDVFAEVDFMDGNLPADPDKIPVATSWATETDAYWNAPILNIGMEHSNGQGIYLHLDHGQTFDIYPDGDTLFLPAAEIKGGTLLAYNTFIRMDGSPCTFAVAGETTENFYDYKNNVTLLAPATQNFDSAARGAFYHYIIFANEHGHSDGSTGRGEIYGNDLFITMSNTSLANNGKVAGTLLHELGHNLNFGHGGAGTDGESGKPNHNSVMCYDYQLYGIDIDCNAGSDALFTYGSGMLKDINEATANENLGLCDNTAIDWDADGTIEASVNSDLSGNGVINTIRDYFSWGNIYFNFRSSTEYGD